MITEKKPKLSVVEHLQDEHCYRVIKRPADDAETFFRRLHKQVTNTDTTIPRVAVEKCFREAGYRLPTPAAIDEAMRKLQILADRANISRKPSSREDLIRATKPYLKALMAASEEWAYYLGGKPPSKSQAIDIGELAEAIQLAKNICSRRVAIDDLMKAMDDWEQRVVHVAMIGRKAWESGGKAPLDATNPETSALTKFTVAAMALLGNPRRPKKDVKRAKPNARSADGEVAYVLRKHKRHLSF
jgi:hypothetical protein